MFWGGDVSRTRLCTTLALRISQSGLEDLWGTARLELHQAVIRGRQHDLINTDLGKTTRPVAELLRT